MPHAKGRLGFRIDPQNKRLIEEAAEILGLTVSSFANTALLEKAREVTERHRITLLQDEDRDAFLAILDRPAAPNENLRRLLAISSE